jgi:PPOX class probable F420-dependent enzyme
MVTMPPMSSRQIRAFLEEGTRTGKLASTRADGSPHVTPVWFVLDGDDAVFTTHATSVKGRTLRRDPRAALCVDYPAPPYSFVIVEGPVELSEDPDALLEWATRIGARYMGAERAEEFGRRNGVPGELLVRLTPAKVIGVDRVSD